MGQDTQTVSEAVKRAYLRGAVLSAICLAVWVAYWLQMYGRSDMAVGVWLFPLVTAPIGVFPCSVLRAVILTRSAVGRTSLCALSWLPVPATGTLVFIVSSDPLLTFGYLGASCLPSLPWLLLVTRYTLSPVILQQQPSTGESVRATPD